MAALFFASDDKVRLQSLEIAMKTSQWMIAVLALALLAPAAPVFGQQANAESSAGMSTRDRAIVRARMADIKESAKIYGYDLGRGNWNSDEAHCAALPGLILLQYRRVFPDGAQSRFTAAVPRSAGRVRIVPVLHHGATPFVPAAANPSNYALFNQLVQQAGQGAAGRTQLSGCYAELTGGDTGPLPAKRPNIAGAPGPTLHLAPESKISSVTLASQATPESYQVWSVQFDNKGRVTKATAEDHRITFGNSPAPNVAKSPSQAPMPVTEPGWKFIPQPPDPPSKFIPSAPQPFEKMTPNE